MIGEVQLAKSLFNAYSRTVDEGDDLREALNSVRQVLLESFSCEEIDLSVEKGERINGLHFKGNVNKAIIFLHGNGCFYELSVTKPLSWIEELKKSKQIPHLVVFNPRGTGKSEGVTTPENVSQDILALSKYLKKHYQIDPNGFVIAGHSMGGFFGAFGAARVQSVMKKAKINFISDRSFYDMHSRVKVKELSPDHDKAVTNFGWDLDQGEALRSLKGRVLIIYNPSDAVIHLEDATHSQLKELPHYCMKEETQELTTRAHNREFSDVEISFIVDEIKQMLNLQ